MKKLILVFTTVAITAGAYAQNDSENIQTNPRELNNSQNPTMQSNTVDQFHPDGIMKQNGKILKVENGRMTTLKNDITLSNGTRVICDGNYYKEDGTKMMLEEGQHLDMAGKMTLIKTNVDYNQYEQNNPVDKTYLDGVMKQNGKIVLVKDGEITVLDHDVTMSNGTRIMSDGNYVKEDGSKMMIEEGQHLDMSGKMTFIKADKDKNMYLVPNKSMNHDHK